MDLAAASKNIHVQGENRDIACNIMCGRFESNLYGRFSETCIMRAEGFWINNLGEQVLARFFFLIYKAASERAAGSEQIKLNFCQPIIERSF
jgi:hypothetical protein